MVIDWFTVSAQALNFLILVWLMKRLLYRPILRAIDAREQRIADEMTRASAAMAQAEAEREQLHAQNQALAAQRSHLLEQAAQAAAEERSRLQEKALRDVASLRELREQAMARDLDAMSESIGRRVQEEVFAIARKALADLAGTDLEERIAGVFIRRIEGLDDQSRGKLAAQLRDAPDNILIWSAFELPAEQRGRIENALVQLAGAPLQARFGMRPGLIGGIELDASGSRISWTIEDYLSTMETALRELGDGHSGHAPERDAKAQPRVENSR